MTTPAAGFVSNEVLATKMDALTAEVRMLRTEQVRADVYAAQREADQARISALEGRLADQAGLKRQVMLAVLAAALAIVVALAKPLTG